MAATEKIWVNNQAPTCEDVDLNGFKSENNNLIVGSGQLLSTSDNQQTHKAVAHYAGVGDYYGESGAADAYILSVTGSQTAPPTYATGLRIRFAAGNENTGAATVNVAGLGVKNIVLDLDGSVLNPGAIGVGISEAYYDGTVFRLTSWAAPVNELAVDVHAATLIQNGDFENDLVGWLLDTSGGGLINLDNTTSGSGSSSVKMTVATLGHSCFIDSAMFNIRANEKYTLSLVTAGTVSLSLKMYIVRYDAAGTPLSTDLIVSTATAGAAVFNTLTFSLSDTLVGAAVKAQLRLDITTFSTVGSAWLDDILLFKQTQALETFIQDAGAYYTADQVEGAFQQLRPEVGTWTPVLVGTTTAGSPIYTTQTGNFYRIGRLVYVDLTIVITAKGGMVGPIRINDIPFIGVTGSNHSISAYSGITTGTGDADLSVRVNSNVLDLRYSADAAVSILSITDTMLSNSTSINVSLCYQALTA